MRSIGPYFRRVTEEEMVSIAAYVFERAFDLKSKRLALGVGGVGRNADGFFVKHFAARKRERDLETVPTVQADFPTKMV